jgi:Zn-dependent alcohol dehydrogenase
MGSAGLGAATVTFSNLHVVLTRDANRMMGSYIGGCVPKPDIPRFIAVR